MTDHGIVVAYEVRWTWHGEREAHRLTDHDRAVHMALIESLDWSTDAVPGSLEANSHRTYKRVSVYAIGPSHRRTLVGTYVNGGLLPERDPE